MYHDEGYVPPEEQVLTDWPEAMSGVSALSEGVRRRRRRRPRPRPALILSVSSQPSLTPAALLPSARVPRFSEAPAGTYQRGLPTRFPVGRQAVAGFASFGQDDEAAPAVTESGAYGMPAYPEGYRTLPSGAIVRLDALGNPRRRGKGFGWFLRHGGIVGWVGRQQFVRKVLPRPVTAAMRFEFEKIPGAMKREFLERHPLARAGVRAFTPSKRRRGRPEEVPAEATLPPEPMIAPPPPIEMSPMAPSFPPMPVAPPAAEGFEPGTPFEEEGAAREEMAMRPIEEHPEMLPPELVAVEHEAAPWPSAPYTPGTERAFEPVPIAPRAEGGLPESPGAELLYRTEAAPTEESMAHLGQPIWWWQPTAPGTAEPFDTLGQGLDVSKVFARHVTPVLETAATVLEPFGRGRFVTPAPTPPLAIPEPERPQPTGGGWLVPAVIVIGGLGAVYWFMQPARAPYRGYRR